MRRKHVDKNAKPSLHGVKISGRSHHFNRYEKWPLNPSHLIGKKETVTV